MSKDIRIWPSEKLSVSLKKTVTHSMQEKVRSLSVLLLDGLTYWPSSASTNQHNAIDFNEAILDLYQLRISPIILKGLMLIFYHSTLYME